MKKLILLSIILVVNMIHTQAQTPNLLLSAGAAGGSGDEGRAIATDAAGNVYVAGSFGGTASFGTVIMNGAGRSDIFIAKYNPAGEIQWARRAGGTEYDSALGIAISTDAVYITGYFNSTANFNTPSAIGSNELIALGIGDIFIAKYDLDGNFQWARRGGSNSGVNYLAEAGHSIAVSGNEVYITGGFYGTANFNTPSATGSNEITSAGGADIFLAKYDSDGNFQWARRAGSTAGDWVSERGYGITVLGTGICITGGFAGTANFNTPSATGSNELVLAGGSSDIFLARYDNNGNLQWLRRAGGTGNQEIAYAIASSGTNIYISGSFSGTANFNTPSATGSNEIVCPGSFAINLFVAKYEEDGDFVWARRAGATSLSDYATGFGIAVLGTSLYITGQFYGTANFNTPSATGSNEISASGSGTDILLAKYNTDGNYQWARRAGTHLSNNSEISYAVATSGTSVYISGVFQAIANFNTPSATGSNELFTGYANRNIFIAKYDDLGAYQWSNRAGIGLGAGVSGASGRDIATDANGNFYVVGDFYGSAVFENTFVLGAGSDDIFIAKYNSAGILQWVKRAGGDFTDICYGIAVSGDAVYITGEFQATVNFNTPLSGGGTTITATAPVGQRDAFLAKYDLDGNFIWARRAGGSSGGISYSIAVSGNGVYMTGKFSGTINFNTPSASGSNEITSAGSNDIYLAKFDTDGNFQWARRAGGSGVDECYGIAVSNSSVYITGYFQGTANFNTPSTSGSNEITSFGTLDIFVARYDSDGNFLWARRAGGTGGNEFGRSIAVSGDNIYVTGRFVGTTNFNNPSATGSNEITEAPGSFGFDFFLAKYNTDGDFQWARRAGGTGSSSDEVYDVVATSNSIYITGTFQGTANFNTPHATGSNEISAAGSFDMFVARYDNTGNFQWARRGGGSGGGVTLGYGITQYNGLVYITGSFSQTANFNTPSASGSNELTVEGVRNSSGRDIFVVRYDDIGSLLPITLLQFEAQRQDEQVKLNWQTASESNNLGFEVQQSDNGIDFRQVSFVDGKGNSNSLSNYHFSFINPNEGYYRLKQIDLDGRFSLSPIRFVASNHPTKILKVSPNPSNGQVILDLDTDIPTTILNIKISSAQGVVLLAANGTLQQINDLLNQKIKHWANGMYAIEARTNEAVFYQRLVLLR